MKKTWLVTSNNQIKYLNELYYFYKFLSALPLFSFKLNSFNKLFLFKFNFIFLKLKNSTDFKIPNFDNYLYNFKKINFFSSKLILEKQKNLKFFELKKTNNIEKKIIYYRHNNFFFLFLNLFLITNYTYSSKNFFPYYYNSLFGAKILSNNVAVMSTHKYFKRWTDSYTLLFNFFYYKIEPVLLGTIFFKKETLALNWHFTSLETNTWKYCFPFYIYNKNLNSSITHSFLKIKNESKFYFVFDCNYHERILHALKKNSSYTLGLIDNTNNPWSVQYPIFILSNGYTAQLFFYKVVILTNKNALYSRFLLFKNIWFKAVFFNSGISYKNK